MDLLKHLRLELSPKAKLNREVMKALGYTKMSKQERPRGLYWSKDGDQIPYKHVTTSVDDVLSVLPKGHELNIELRQNIYTVTMWDGRQDCSGKNTSLPLALCIAMIQLTALDTRST